ncbi:hypothetical protein H0H93_010507 [Arthromyces matolae]|nr:hypothetical protein H0H93_010507 [Arthromyces matolae]
MSWLCIPVQKFRFSKRRRSHKQLRSTASQGEPMGTGATVERESEPDVYYLVPSKYGPGTKRVARGPPLSRTHPPPVLASLPMDNESTRGATSEWTAPAHAPMQRMHALERLRSPSPSPSPADYARATITKLPGSSVPKTPSIPRLHNIPSSPIPIPNLPNNRRKDETTRANVNDIRESRDKELYEVHGDYGRIMNELDRNFGEAPDLTLGPAQSHEEQELPGQALNATKADTGNSNISYPARLGSVNRAGGAGVTKSSTSHLAFPRPRHSFEIVERRVVESGPEKTVTISTWREQVADEADQKANMDVYYLDATGYLEAAKTVRNLGEEEEEEEDMDRVAVEDERSDLTRTESSRIRARKRSLPSPPIASPPMRQQTSSDPAGSIRTISDEASESPEPASVRRTISSPMSRQSSGRSPSPLQNAGKSSASGSRSQPVIWHPTPPQTPPHISRAKGTIQDTPAHSHTQLGRNPGPRLNNVLSNESAGGNRSMPVRSTTTPQPRQIPDASRPKNQPPPQPPRSSTPNRTYVRRPGPSFHPTQSGSTISTIKSELESPESTVALEQILSSCNPSLIHLAPRLAKLGIINEGHLRAIARLSDDTRNRELRDAALRQGITIMDWAILMDRLQLL